MAGQYYIVYVIVIAMLILNVSSQDFTCDGNRTAVESGRSCRPACENLSDCVGTVCICDDTCGKSCVNKNTKCSRPGNIKNGNVVFTSLSYGSVATFSCDENYILYGSQERRCRSDRKWSGLKTNCRQYKCPAPKAMANSDFQPKAEAYYAGSRVTYQCSDGYFLGRNDDYGQPIVTTDNWCESRGLWFGDSVTCIPINECEPRTSPENGQLFSYLPSSILTYSKVKYSCNRGFQLVGSEFLLCDMITGEWSGAAPTCDGILCPDRSPPVNGQMVSSNGRLVGSMVVFTCNNGFELSGTQTSFCLQSGEWSQQPGTCESKRCKATSYIPGTYSITADDTSVGSELEFKCADGLRQAVAPNLYCSENGDWTPKVNCEEIRCPDRPAPKNGKAEYEPAGTARLRPNTRLTYSCDDGYRLVGYKTSYCHREGTWSDDEPSYCSEVSDDGYDGRDWYNENEWAMSASATRRSQQWAAVVGSIALSYFWI